MAKFEELSLRYMVDLIRDFDLKPFQAAAVVGNAGTESGGFTQIQEINPTSGRGGLGHFQWTGPRRRDFEAWLERNADKGWTAETYEANYSMLFRELVGPESATIPALKQAGTIEDATKAFMDKFERPGVPHLDNRISWARKALAAFDASGVTVTKPVPAPLGIDPALLQQLFAALMPLILNALTGRVTPAPVVVPKPVDTTVRTDVRAGLIGVIGSLAASFFGIIGDPVGPGATTTGALLPLLSIGAAAMGIPAPLLNIGKSLLGMLVSKVPR
jgi:hypothetical protein